MKLVSWCMVAFNVNNSITQGTGETSINNNKGTTTIEGTPESERRERSAGKVETTKNDKNIIILNEHKIFSAHIMILNYITHSHYGFELNCTILVH